MKTKDVLNKSYRDNNGVLRGSTGAIINDGSSGFNNELISRIEKMDKRIGVTPIKGFADALIKKRRLRYAR